ncbi:uncharacterized protein [Nicotiana sylvestris]|uniref:uncharacterized protein n=1 Tax=Nicotiana sylvestris TaxID=4096 RepID=UPI00388C781E
MPDDEQHRLERLGKLQPPTFSGAEGEDAQGFLDKCQRMLRTVGLLESSGVAFTIFQFLGAAFSWWEDFERRSPVGATPLSWQQFSALFLEKYVPQSHREELRRQFEWLTQGDMTVTQYEVRERVLVATFEEVVDIACEIETARRREREEREAKRPQGSSSFGGTLSRDQFQRGRGRSFRPTQSAHPEYSGASLGRGHQGFQQGQSSLSTLPAQSSSRAPSVQGSFVAGPSTGHSGARGSLQSPSLALGSCFKCGEFGYMRRQCPRLRGGQYQQRDQSSISAPVTSPPTHPARGGG